MPKIFLSHTFADKPVVEPVALALRDIYGEDQVFYDAWSIQPGDGIIEKMNSGLQAPDFVFFFVSENSLKSKMVGLEWQAALMNATKDHCRLIPVRVDGAPLPPLLLQSFYIDMFSNGVEAATLQIVKAVRGNSTFVKQHSEFSNLTWTVSGDPTSRLLVPISASHVMEPRPNFRLTFSNKKGDVRLWILGAPGVRSWPDEEPVLPDGTTKLLMGCASFDGAPITPKFPLIFEVKALKGATIQLETVLHETAPGTFKAIPEAS